MLVCVCITVDDSSLLQPPVDGPVLWTSIVGSTVATNNNVVSTTPAHTLHARADDSLAPQTLGTAAADEYFVSIISTAELYAASYVVEVNGGMAGALRNAVQYSMTRTT